MKIAIIGAGLTGLLVARTLLQHGVHVEIFEKSRGLGGRLSTKRLPWANVDIGAQYFTARHPRFRAQVDSWLADGTVALWDFMPHRFDGKTLRLSPDETERFVGTPKMNSLAHKLSGDVQIHLRNQISGLARRPLGWQLLSDSGDEISSYYDWVVTTSPAEQSRQLMKDTGIAQRIPENVHLPCWALGLATLANVDTDIHGIFGDDEVSWVSRLSSKPGREASRGYDLWMLHFSPTWSAEHPKESMPNLTETGLAWLDRALASNSQSALQAIHSYQHYWRYARLDERLSNNQLIVDCSLGLAALGAWSAGGKVEGAYLSAMAFLDYFFDRG